MSQSVEIERNGKKNSQSTTYSFYPSNDVDGKGLEDFPEKQNLLGTLIIDASEKDMEDMVNGNYKTASEENNKAERRETRREGSNQRPARNSRRTDRDII